MISTSAELEGLIDGTVNIPTIPAALTEITDISTRPAQMAEVLAATRLAHMEN